MIEPVKVSSYIDKVENKEISPFKYLKETNEYLSNPINNGLGRELVIRALDKKHLFEGRENLLMDMVRKSGLYPYIDKFFKITDSDMQFAIDLYKTKANDGFIFHTLQARVYNYLLNGKNVVLSAPTSMGKSAIVDSVLYAGDLNKVVIVVPTIALIDETRRRIKNKFSEKYQVIYHNSQELTSDKAVYVLTQERVNERSDMDNIDLFIIDEFYKLSFGKEDNNRSIALNIAMSKLLMNSKQFYLIGPYIDEVKGLENISKDYIFIPTDFKTVAVNIHCYNIKPKNAEGKLNRTKDIILEKGGQTIIYCMSQNSISELATQLIKMKSLASYRKDSELTKIIDWIKNNYGENWIYCKALDKGIAIHHGTLPRALQQLSLDLFNSGRISILLCTSTIIEGVNTVAENVIVFDNKRSKYLVDSFTHKNISGRAGRMNQHLIGNVYCLEALPKDENDKKIVELPLGSTNENTPINLLVGIQEEHLSSTDRDNMNSYFSRTDVPVEIIKNHTSYDPEIIEKAYERLSEFSVEELDVLTKASMSSAAFFRLITSLIKHVEYNSLMRLSLHYEDNDDLKNRIMWYVYANSHSEYMFDRVTYISENVAEELHSRQIDNELKICKNIFKHNIPRTLSLYQDLINFELKSLGIKKEADYGYLIHKFENSNLPTNFTALEEMGVPIETLDKVKKSKLMDFDIEELCIALKQLSKIYSKFDSVDKYFIEKALG
ncbi:DEAD/DEAH box helicase [Vibrio splendidus]